MTGFLAAEDLQPLLRWAPQWREAQIREMLAACLDQATDSSRVDSWERRLNAQRGQKEKC
jgi:hypothetical protein